MNKNNKGFTLVELIVVLVILAILAAVLVPALLGYIDRAKDQQYINEAKDLMRASQAGIVEAYAKNKVSFDYSTREHKQKKAPVSGEYGYYTSDILYDAGKNVLLTEKKPGEDDRGAAAKNIISKSLLKYIEAKDYDFYRGKESFADGQDVAALKGKVGFILLYNDQGAIVYAQYSRDGKLVTFDGKKYTVEDGGHFADKFRN
ncbi:MAG: prepilin-type N-terminal cleavage/methylation domain-containing protein [Lachnospiraceae bacterium]|nr:prepilin-type N-terminal cleavage/methylation domain-containing protein [Lachnospiraceae bacterium]